MKTKQKTQALGIWGEETAARYLQSFGWTILDRNWRCSRGELDIVAFDPYRDALVAVEVKTRRSLRQGLPQEAVTPAKLERIRLAFRQWRSAQHRRATHIAIDVLALTVETYDNFRINHIRDAL
ncbi:YraN family protein [Arcanobacterium buesumense]|uniref:UPF0102 protein HC352_02845 n=1 Tax=Arcanobacterium buesumense TaxID=2722751 RepID=A0A6H2EK23_9ACTO|nr:YraN family protein [Arcanobacterium buesumense]QJC21550.1 YraN family protein [Arcanobacterium buesumense]